MGISNVDSTYEPRKNTLPALDHFPSWHDIKVESARAKYNLIEYFLYLPVCPGQIRPSEM